MLTYRFFLVAFFFAVFFAAFFFAMSSSSSYQILPLWTSDTTSLDNRTYEVAEPGSKYLPPSSLYLRVANPAAPTS